jgi:hypothetical protein
MSSLQNDREDSNPLQSLNLLQPPPGMQERLAKNIAERARQQHLHPVARGYRKYSWELWIGASIAAVAMAVIVCILALHTHRTANLPLEANLPAHKIIPVPAHTDAVQTSSPPHAAARTHPEPRRTTAAFIPHTPPPLPLTAQERLLLELASAPSLAAGTAISQPVTDHGLGANSLFELDHEQLTPLQPAQLESTPLPSLPSNPTSSGENQ